jgi:hypothetical protein
MAFHAGDRGSNPLGTLLNQRVAQATLFDLVVGVKLLCDSQMAWSSPDDPSTLHTSSRKRAAAQSVRDALLTLRQAALKTMARPPKTRVPPAQFSSIMNPHWVFLDNRES